MNMKYVTKRELSMEIQTPCLENPVLKVTSTVQELRRNLRLKIPLHDELLLQHHRNQTRGATKEFVMSS